MLSVEDWAEIRRLHRAEQMPIKAIARVMGVSRNTGRAAAAPAALAIGTTGAAVTTACPAAGKENKLSLLAPGGQSR